MKKLNKNSLIILFVFLIPIVSYLVLNQSNNKKIDFSSSNKPQVIDFSSKYCLECQDLKKVLNPLEEKYKDKIDFIKIDIATKDKQSQLLVKKYNVKVVPTLVFIDKKKHEEIINGYMDEKTLEKHLRGIIN